MTRLSAYAGYLLAAALPVLLWHDAMGAIASDFRLEIGYLLTGWSGYALIGAGLVLLLPVAWSSGRRPDSRLYPHLRNAYMGWGLSLYILGAALASQVAAAV